MGNGPEFGGESRFVRSPEVLWRQSADVLLVRTLSDSDVIELGGSAVLLWLALLEPATADQLIAELADVVGAPVNVVARDVRVALTALEQRGLVVRLEGAP